MKQDPLHFKLNGISWFKFCYVAYNGVHGTMLFKNFKVTAHDYMRFYIESLFIITKNHVEKQLNIVECEIIFRFPNCPHKTKWTSFSITSK